MSSLTPGAILSVVIAGLPVAAFAVCVTPRCGEQFSPAVERLRRQIQRECDCARRADTPAAYRSCAKRMLRTEAQHQREDLPKACLAAVRRCELASICGDTSRAVVCCHRKANGRFDASIKGRASACRGLACQRPRHVAEVCGPDTPARVGPFADRGQTVLDKGTGLEWEKKEPTAGPSDAHAPGRSYVWAGSCAGPTADRFSNPLCQPSAAAAAACKAQTPAGQWMRGCEPCAASDGQCVMSQGATTVWEWLVQLNVANFAGHGDWRLPTVGQAGGAAELETIFDPIYASCSDPQGPAPPRSPGDSTLFGSTTPGRYWSATSQEAPYADAFQVDARRLPTFAGKRDLAYVRAVRAPGQARAQ